jgi:hypothetical protein
MSFCPNDQIKKEETCLQDSDGETRGRKPIKKPRLRWKDKIVTGCVLFFRRGISTLPGVAVTSSK